MRTEKDVMKFRINWCTANQREFQPGEVLGVLLDCINKHLSAKGASGIVPPGKRWWC